MLVVRNCFRQVLQRSKRACADVYVCMSILVRQSHEETNPGSHEHRVEICTDGEVSLRPQYTLPHREQRGYSAPHLGTSRTAERQSDYVQHCHDSTKNSRTHVWTGLPSGH